VAVPFDRDPDVQGEPDLLDLPDPGPDVRRPRAAHEEPTGPT